MVSLLPGLRSALLRLTGAGEWRDRVAPALSFTHARYALHWAYGAAGLGPGAVLLAPAYHCRTMLDGAVRRGAAVDFYPLTERLEPDLDALRGLLLRYRGRLKVVLATHFFGFAQNLEALAQMSRDQGALLVEDCSHISPHLYGTPGAGAVGEFAVGSIYKFGLAEEGGLLWSAVPDRQALLAAAPAQRRGGSGEVRAVVQAWRRGRRTPTGRRPGCSSGAAGELGVDRHEDVLTLSSAYDPARESAAPARVSEWLGRHTDYLAAAAKRRANYQRLSLASRGWLRARPLFPALPAGVVPYMLPLLLDDDSGRSFDRLKRCAVPLGRWDDMAASGCPVSARLRLQLVHLPVHQDLTPADLDEICARIGDVLGGDAVAAKGRAA